MYAPKFSFFSLSLSFFHSFFFSFSLSCFFVGFVSQWSEAGVWGGGGDRRGVERRAGLLLLKVEELG